LFESQDYSDADLVALQNIIKQQVASLRVSSNIVNVEASEPDVESLTPESLLVDALEEAEEDRFRAEVSRYAHLTNPSSAFKRNLSVCYAERKKRLLKNKRK
jgi:hypothetical protein